MTTQESRHKSMRWTIVRTVTLLVVLQCLNTLVNSSRSVKDRLTTTTNNEDGVSSLTTRKEPLHHITNALLQAHSTLPFTQYRQPPPHLHPFAGALDELQNWGYVHDAKVLRRHPVSVNLTQADMRGVCNDNSSTSDYVNSDGDQVLDKVQISHTNPQQPRILCAIYTYKGHAANIQAVAETWGSRCDGFLAASTYTHRSTGTVHLPHFGKEGHYNSIWQKVRSMMAYIYTHYGHEYDYFHISGDDTYVVVENLKRYLMEERVVNATRHNQPVYAGGWIKPFWRMEGRKLGFLYNGGGPGYTLNRAALELFVTRGLAECNPNTDKSEEDWFMGACLKALSNNTMTTPTDTTDRDHRARYHHRDPNNLLQIHSRDGNFQQFAKKQKQWRQEFLKEPVDPLEAVSPHSVAFHLIKQPNYMRRLDAILYPQGEMARYCARQQLDKTIGALPS